MSPRPCPPKCWDSAGRQSWGAVDYSTSFSHRRTSGLRRERLAQATRVLEKTKPKCNHGRDPCPVSSRDTPAEPAAKGQACLAEPRARKGADATCRGERREARTQTRGRGAEERRPEVLQPLY